MRQTYLTRRMMFVFFTVIAVALTLVVVIKGRFTFRNEAAFSGQTACREGVCSIDPLQMNAGDFGKWKLTVYKNGEKLPYELIIGSSQDSSLPFSVDNIEARYECRFEPVDSQSGLPQVCGPVSQQNACGPGQCTCDIAGGLDCTNRVTGFKDPEEQGPGLVIINPRYNAPPDSCFVCDEIIVRDASTEQPMNARFDCQGRWLNYNGPTPVPTGIRLHQAKEKACRTYQAMVIGHNPSVTPATTPQPVTCGDCQAEVCCPLCTPPTTLPIPGDPHGTLSCVDNKCNFKILNGNRCLAVGEEIRIALELQKDGACIDFDDEFAQDLPDGDSNNRDKHICKKKEGNILRDLRNGDTITFKYVDGGVYDITLNCDPAHASPQATPPLEKNELVCRKRVTASCRGDSIINPPFPPTNTPTPLLTPAATLGPTLKLSITPSPTGPISPPPPVCPPDEKLNVRIMCPECNK